MNVDRELVNTAEELLHERFPQRPGLACAVYTRQGEVFTGVSAVEGGNCIEPEAAPITESKERGEMITALVTLGWEGPGSDVVVRPPSPAILVRLKSQARRHAQIAVGGSASGAIRVQPLWELVNELEPQHDANAALLHGRFGGGMKAIAHELMGFAQVPGVPRARAEFSDVLLEGLGRKEIRLNSIAPAPAGSKFMAPAQLKSVSLRHIWLAFEYASEKFTFALIDSLRPGLIAIGCNDADIVHIKQGLEALRNIFSVLVVLTGTRREVLNECPFFPYDSFRLRSGVPIHQYIGFEELGGDGAGDTAARNETLVRQLIGVLARRGEGGFTGYLRQRGLFKVDLFNGGGTGHCPFSQMSNEIIYATAAGLERALSERVIILAPDELPSPLSH